MVLMENNFDFNKLHFLQVRGTAMATRVAPSYANLFMDLFERRHVYTHRNSPCYGRDASMISSCYETVAHLSYKRLLIIWMPVSLALNSRLTYRIVKLISIPYSQFLRLMRICSNDNDFVVQRKILALSLHKAYYPDQIIQAAFDRALEHDCNAQLAPKHSNIPKNQRNSTS